LLLNMVKLDTLRNKVVQIMRVITGRIMAVDKNVFFRDVTLKLCGSLQINVAFGRAFDYLRQHFPVDHMYLDIPDESLSAQRHIAFASIGSEKPEEIIPLPEGLWNWVRGVTVPIIVSASDEDAHIKALAPLVRLAGHSDLVVPLRIESQLIGFVVLRARGEGVFTQEHIDLLSVVAEPFAMALANALAHEAAIKYADRLADDNRFLRKELLSKTGEEIIGENSGLRNVMEMVRQVAPLANTVLLMGETGTGKEVFANVIHGCSPRKDGPFIKVNCGAIPESLIDSELFGHEKGAFTGAVSEKLGRFERANGGTLFLDEIGELPLQAQVRLLRVLQTREIERVGGERSIPVDVRIIAATHRNLESMVSENQFREDLWFRLNVFPIIVPPLRQRKDDIPALTRYLVETKSRELGFATPPPIAPGALERLINYAWPGNVRELENIVERELIRHKGGQLRFDLVLVAESSDRPRAVAEAKAGGVVNLDQVVTQHILRVLRTTEGKIFGPGGAAELLGVNPNTLRARMNKLGIKYGRRAG
jgi:transcriptional regulator with GAF, ATPase, and Fis domain